ncbi:MAG: proline--tRNA ligase [Phycisphaerae bacterium]|nr:proline--tRNA ligase [Phycisphaerae bacterium]MDD5381982.1 proline--tRNA ligase [Phycisphaerae bacterium]
MRYSRMLIPTVKEAPADAEVTSHKLMLRAGLMRKVSSGTYTYLPLGWRSLLKVITIVREEMNKAGAQEILMPSVQPMELWQKTGRDVDYGQTMAKFQDRHDHWNVIAPTAEEVVTTLAAGEINSYKQLPMNIYQISFKFRDEFRPRFGPIRSREFIMKDAYSFHADEKCLDKEYWNMYETYKRIFKRCGLGYVIVEAESGEMGGSGSHQFTIPCESGEDIIVYTEDSSYAANIEKAAVDALPKQKPLANVPKPEEVHTPNVGSIEAVCAFLKTQPKDMIKTLIYTTGTDQEYRKERGAYEADHKDENSWAEPILQIERKFAVLIRGDHDLNPEKLTQILGGKHAELADEAAIKKITGAKVGFAGPIGLAGKISKLIIDHAVAAMAVGVTGANKTDYHIKNVVPGRDFPLEGDNIIVADVRNAVEGDTYNGKKLLFRHGIEVGQVFKLGTKYSVKLGAKFLDETGKEQPCLMGCYGIGINRIVASAIEAGNDANGIIFPISIAPFEVIVTSVNQDDKEVVGTAEKIYQQLLDKNIEVLLDDRDLRGGIKFKDADLLGIPVRITVGSKSLKEGNIEIKLRSESQCQKVPVKEALNKTVELVDSLKKPLNC